MRTDTTEKVLEKLATSDKVTIVVERQSGDQALEVRNVDGRLHIARKPRDHDEWDPYVPPHDPYGPGCERNRLRGDQFTLAVRPVVVAYRLGSFSRALLARASPRAAAFSNHN